jgi:GTP-binding protein
VSQSGPVLVLIGRPNVGKSTLFNRLTKTRQALVADFPGLTRDRQIYQAYYKDKPYMVVDTGGLGIEDAQVDALMSKQTHCALSEADLVLFMVDGRAGLTPLDEEIAAKLRKFSKPTYLVVNKADGLAVETICHDFQRLGIRTMYPISASHGQGIEPLLDDAITTFGDFKQDEVDDNVQENAIQIAFIGRPNVGKSTLINRILGEERVVVYDAPGTTRDSISIPFEREGQDYILIDTAGIRRRARVDEKIEKFSVIKTLQAIQAAAVCLMLVDGQDGLTDQDLHLLGLILEAGKALIIVVNKWDGLEQDHKERIKQEIERRLRFVDFSRIRFISALHGTGVGLLFKDILEAYQASTKKFSTSFLTRVLGQITHQHVPPLVNGRRIKLRYAHFGGHNPPMIIIHGNQLDKLPASYTRYLAHAFMKHLGLVGTPIKFEFKNSANPYAGKKNVLTPRQVKRKKRLMKHVKS